MGSSPQWRAELEGAVVATHLLQVRPKSFRDHSVDEALTAALALTSGHLLARPVQNLPLSTALQESNRQGEMTSCVAVKASAVALCHQATPKHQG